MDFLRVQTTCWFNCFRAPFCTAHLRPDCSKNHSTEATHLKSIGLQVNFQEKRVYLQQQFNSFVDHSESKKKNTMERWKTK